MIVSSDGSSAGDVVATETPFPNRGFIVPDVELRWADPDFCKLTVWSGLEPVQDCLWSFCDEWAPEPVQEWVDLGPRRGSVRSTWSLSDGFVKVLVYGAEGKTREYVSVELSGASCGVVRRDGLVKLNRELMECGEVRCSRLDLAWDGVPFTVAQVRGWAESGSGVGKGVSAEHTAYHSNAEGATVYVQGPKERKGDRLVRVYDRRGPVRLEIELKGDWAARVFCLMAFESSGWEDLAYQALLAYVDFRDVSDGGRSNRADRLPEWERFVGDREGIEFPVMPRRKSTEALAIGVLDGLLQRYARRLHAGIEAYGVEWFVERVRGHALRRWGAEDAEFVEKLKRWEGSEFIGLQGVYGGDVPF